MKVLFVKTIIAHVYLFKTLCIIANMKIQENIMICNTYDLWKLVN